MRPYCRENGRFRCFADRRHSGYRIHWMPLMNCWWCQLQGDWKVFWAKLKNEFLISTGLVKSSIRRRTWMVSVRVSFRSTTRALCLPVLEMQRTMLSEHYYVYITPRHSHIPEWFRILSLTFTRSGKTERFAVVTRPVLIACLHDDLVNRARCECLDFEALGVEWSCRTIRGNRHLVPHEASAFPEILISGQHFSELEFVIDDRRQRLCLPRQCFAGRRGRAAFVLEGRLQRISNQRHKIVLHSQRVLGFALVLAQICFTNVSNQQNVLLLGVVASCRLGRRLRKKNIRFHFEKWFFPNFRHSPNQFLANWSDYSVGWDSRWRTSELGPRDAITPSTQSWPAILVACEQPD